jgi:hypothetical protein
MRIGQLGRWPSSYAHHHVPYSAIKIKITPTLAILNTVEVE